MESNYLQKLSLEHPEVGERYQMKLKLVNGLDPFTSDMDTMEYSIDGIPSVTNMDIIRYLVYSHNFHTEKQMEAFKSLQAYKYFESSFVLKVGTILRDNIFVLVGKEEVKNREAMKKSRAHYRYTNSKLKIYSFTLIFITVVVILYVLYVRPASKPEINNLQNEDIHRAMDLPNILQQVQVQDFDKIHGKTYDFKGYKVVHIDLKGAPPKISYFDYLFPLFNKMGATGVLLEYEDMFPYSGRLKNISAYNAYTMQDISKLNSLAAKNSLELIPLIQTFGHLEFLLKLDEFRYLREMEEFPSAICPSHEDTLSLLSEMLHQVLLAHPTAKMLHMGADEVFFIGACEKCVNNMDKYSLSKKLLYMKHVNNVAEEIIKYRPNIKILIWDDVLRTSTHHELKEGKLNRALIPVVWKYTEDVFDELGPSLWDMYAQVFPRIWIGSAFKGATGSDQLVADVTHYVENNRAWMSLVSEYKNKIDFEGIILTGWQRYDHFAILCELLPVSLPSLALCLGLIHGHDNSPLSAPTDVAKLLQCKQPYGLIGSAFGSPSCSYPGGVILENVLRLHQLKIEYEHFLEDSRTRGWMTEYNIAHDFSNPQNVISVSIPLRTMKYELDQIDAEMIDALAEIYDNYTIEEWKETFITPFRNKVKIMLEARDKFLERKSWPRRPLTSVKKNEV